MKPAVDDSTKSVFVLEMEAAIKRRLAAASWRDKSAVDREIRTIIQTHLGRDAWDAMVDADPARSVPRPPRLARKAKRDRGGRRFRRGFDHKMAQAGDRENDE
jgi:hypothetical protein